MATKMTIPGIGAALMLGMACAKKYQPAGAAPPLNASGTYSARESVYSSTCGPRLARKETFLVEVYQPPNARTVRLTVAGLSYDATIDADGYFSTTSLVVPSGQVTSSTTGLGGRFTATGFTSRVSIKTVEPVRAARAGEPTTVACEYQLRWEAEKQ